MRVFVDRNLGITRLVQQASSRNIPPRWRDGVCVRLPSGWSVIVDYRMPRFRNTPYTSNALGDRHG